MYLEKNKIKIQQIQYFADKNYFSNDYDKMCCGVKNKHDKVIRAITKRSLENYFFYNKTSKKKKKMLGTHFIKQINYKLYSYNLQTEIIMVYNAGDSRNNSLQTK